MVESFQIRELALGVQLLVRIQRHLAPLILLAISLAFLPYPSSFFGRDVWFPPILNFCKLRVDAVRLLQLDPDFLGAPKTVCAVQHVRSGLRDIFSSQSFRRRLRTADRQRCRTYRALETTAGASEEVTNKLPSIHPCHSWVGQRRHTYLFPSLFTLLLGTSNRQFGQYQHTISSSTHLGQRIW